MHAEYRSVFTVPRNRDAARSRVTERRAERCLVKGRNQQFHNSIPRDGSVLFDVDAELVSIYQHSAENAARCRTIFLQLFDTLIWVRQLAPVAV